jgi:chlorobactene lauroyltransferase
MMLEKELTRYRFFARLGAYSVDPEKPKSVLASLKYSAELLKERPNPPLVCIFPQGELRPWGKRPLTYKRGIERILQEYGGSANILPLAIRCEHLSEQRPEVFFLFGKNYIYDADNFPGVSFFEEMEEYLLDDLQLRILYQDRGATLMNGSLSVNRKMDALRGKEEMVI